MISEIELFRKKKLTVKRNSGASVSFMISPTRLGEIEIKASASSSTAQDSAIKTLRVKAEGEALYFSKTLLLDLRQSSAFKGNVTFELPKNLVQGSEYVEVSVVGDLLGPSIINLENLVNLPTGCAEQNLVHFVPNVIILNYLRNTGQLTPAVESQAISYLETSYQEQLSYRKPDGSFSAFGKTDERNSVW